MKRRALTDLEAVRAQDLLVQRASEGLDDSETRELAALGAREVTSFDLASAMVDVATTRNDEDMPEPVANAVLATALALLQKPGPPLTAPALPAVAASMTVRAVPAPRATSRVTARRAPRLALLAALAAAMIAGLVLGRVTSPDPETSPPAPAPAAASDDVVTRWTGDVAGTVRWSKLAQRGVIHIRGLPVNDPDRERYQLWIVDLGRDHRYPVDGGLFDVRGPDVEVEFRPRLPVATANEWIITREPPTGVVVSERSAVMASARLP